MSISELRKITNVMDYGARGDGITDDAPAIQRAFHYVSRNWNQTILFPSGKYLIKTPLVLATCRRQEEENPDFNELSIEGEKDSHIIAGVVMDHIIFLNYHTNVGNDSIPTRIQNLIFDGQQVAKTAIIIDWVPDLSILQNRIQHVENGIQYLHSQGKALFCDNIFITAFGITLHQNGGDLVIKNNHFHIFNGIGIEFQRSNGYAIITGNKFSKSYPDQFERFIGIQIDINPETCDEVRDIRIDENQFHGAKCCIQTVMGSRRSDRDVAYDFTISFNTISDSIQAANLCFVKYVDIIGNCMNLENTAVIITDCYAPCIKFNAICSKRDSTIRIIDTDYAEITSNTLQVIEENINLVDIGKNCNYNKIDFA